jgi:hypothetical protein
VRTSARASVFRGLDAPLRNSKRGARALCLDVSACLPDEQSSMLKYQWLMIYD